MILITIKSKDTNIVNFIP